MENLEKSFTKEVDKGRMLPITVRSIMKIKHLSIIPLGIAKQFTRNEQVDKIPKKCATHDVSFPAPSGILSKHCYKIVYMDNACKEFYMAYMRWDIETQTKE